MKTMLFPALLALAGCAATVPTHYGSSSTEPSTLYNFDVTNIDGKDLKLDHYKGKVLLIVNVASKCGNTPQYTALEDLYKKYKSKGLVVLGFPANDFMHQEPGTNAEIKEFCSATYHVDFPMFSKITVKGEDINPLYKWLVANSDRPSDPIEWNFAKFIIDRSGKEVKRIAPSTKPDDPTVIEAIESTLDAK